MGATGEPAPSRDELTLAWGDHVLARLSPGARALYKSGRFVEAADDTAVYALPNSVHRDRCEKRRTEVEQALGAHFGRPVPLRLVVAAAATPPVDDAPAAAADVDIEPAGEPAAVTSPLEHVMQAFQGAEVVEE